MKKKFFGIFILLFVIAIFILIDNRYRDLGEITGVDLNDIYIKGRRIS